MTVEEFQTSICFVYRLELDGYHDTVFYQENATEISIRGLD